MKYVYGCDFVKAVDSSHKLNHKLSHFNTFRLSAMCQSSKVRMNLDYF